MKPLNMAGIMVMATIMVWTTSTIANPTPHTPEPFTILSPTGDAFDHVSGSATATTLPATDTCVVPKVPIEKFSLIHTLKRLSNSAVDAVKHFLIDVPRYLSIGFAKVARYLAVPTLCGVYAILLPISVLAIGLGMISLPLLFASLPFILLSFVSYKASIALNDLFASDEDAKEQFKKQIIDQLRDESQAAGEDAVNVDASLFIVEQTLLVTFVNAMKKTVDLFKSNKTMSNTTVAGLEKMKEVLENPENVKKMDEIIQAAAKQERQLASQQHDL